MCGFAGYIDLRGERRVDRDVLARMTNTLVHRGPDSSGYFVRGNVGLGFRRLSIIDLEGGDQPIYNEDGSVVTVCNGEIYNYRELREGLSKKGHAFATRCDVEVLAHLYEEHGSEFLNLLNGQFAFAVYGRKQDELLLARDHFGINPLFYGLFDGVLVFASEIKAILEHPLARREIDPTGLDQILSFPGLVSPRTMFKGIRSLKSGSCLLVRGGEVSVRQYWDLDYPTDGEVAYDRPESYYVERLGELFEQSVRYRLQADVPVGFYLSGGLDSSMVGAMIRRLSPEVQRHAFSMALSEAAREAGVPVILTGEGADELFAGYVGYRFDQYGVRGANTFDVAALLEEELREKLWGDRSLFYETDQYAFREVKAALYSSRLAESFADFDCLGHELVDRGQLRGRHPIHQRSYLDFKLRLSDHLISDHGDRMALANSVEARYPFLDVELVEFSRLIPPSLKLNNFTEKYVLKRVAERLLPREIVGREKFGFHAPGSPYLLRQNIEWVNDLLSHAQIKRQGYFDPDVVERLKEQYSAEGFRLNLPFESDLLMIVLTFGLFCEVFRLPSLN
jgi:asparagine synthase (glutamine-hydrolysing)